MQSRLRRLRRAGAMVARCQTVTLPTAADVDAAAERLAGVAVRTPLINAPVLDERVGARVFLKAETLQRTGSFKFRGAYNKISSIPPEQARRRRGRLFVRQSRAGRRGRGASCSACARPSSCRRMRRAPSASAPRRSAPRSCSTTATRKTARRSRDSIADERGATLVPPYDDPMIIAGQGTIGREIVEDLAALGLEARDRGDRRVGRRARRRHRARRQGARARGASSIPPSRKASTTPRARSRAGERETNATHERHDLRRADDADAGRDDVSDQPRADRARALPSATPRSAARCASPSRN